MEDGLKHRVAVLVEHGVLVRLLKAKHDSTPAGNKVTGSYNAEQSGWRSITAADRTHQICSQARLCAPLDVPGDDERISVDDVSYLHSEAIKDLPCPSFASQAGGKMGFIVLRAETV